MFSRSLSHHTANTDRAAQPTLGWQEASFVLNTLLKGKQKVPLGSAGEILSDDDHHLSTSGQPSSISPISLSLQINDDCAMESPEFLLELLTTDFETSLPQWMQRSLGDIYWNRQLIEQLDEGCLTKLAFLVSSTLKKQRRHYRHFAELSVYDASLDKLSLLSGLGITNILFSVSLMQTNRQLTTDIFNAVAQAKYVGLSEIEIRLNYDVEKIGAYDLVSLFMDLPSLGNHDLLLNPVIHKERHILSLWGLNDELISNRPTAQKIRRVLTSQGYKASSLGQFSFTGKAQKPLAHRFDLRGLPRALSPDFIGIGPSAISRLGNYRIENDELDTYVSKLTNEFAPKHSCEKLAPYFLDLEPEIIEFTNRHKFNLKKAAKIMGKTELARWLEQIKSTIGNSLSITPTHLSVEEDLMEHIPLICSELINHSFGNRSNRDQVSKTTANNSTTNRN